MNQRELRKWLEVCRTERDLSLPESGPFGAEIARDPVLRAAWDDVRRVDAAVGRALRDVAVPEGLEERLLRQLGSADPAATLAVADLETPDAGAAGGRGSPVEREGEVLLSGKSSATGPVPPHGSRATDQREGEAHTAMGPAPRPAGVAFTGTTRSGSLESGRQAGPVAGRSPGRRWIGMLAALAALAAAVCALAGYFVSRAEPSLGDERERVVAWIDALDESGWSRSAGPTAWYPLPAELVVRPQRWQEVAWRRGVRGVVCYELSSAGSPALLFVARGRPRASLESTPPMRLYPVRRPWYVASWKGPAAVYVLALADRDVSGKSPQDRYDRLLRRGPGLVAHRDASSKVPAAGTLYLAGT